MSDQPENEPLPETIDFSAGDVEAIDSQSEVDALREQVRTERDRYLRATAELENYRKRAQREMQDSRRYAELDLLLDLLPVMDNLERGLTAAEKEAEKQTAGGSLLEGFRMLGNQLREVLVKHRCEAIEQAGEAFDPNLHQAILQQPTGDHPDGTVLTIAVKGYRLHERTIRPAQVIVSKSPEA